MSRKLDAVRRALKDGVATDLEARRLAKTALSELNPQAFALEEKLTHAFRQIPVADQLRGDSERARDTALEILIDAERQSKNV